MKLEFKSKDFNIITHATNYERDMIAKAANIALEKMLFESPSIYQHCDSTGWYMQMNIPKAGTGLQAKLVNIEPIEKLKCGHSKQVTVLPKFVNSTVLSEGKVGFDFFDFNSWECLDCGVKLKAKWEEIK